jgi:hypothetical protein
MYVCLCVCVLLCVCVYMWICLCVHVCVCLCEWQVCICDCVCMYVRLNLCDCVTLRTRLSVCLYIYLFKTGHQHDSRLPKHGRRKLPGKNAANSCSGVSSGRSGGNGSSRSNTNSIVPYKRSTQNTWHVPKNALHALPCQIANQCTLTESDSKQMTSGTTSCK